MKIKKTLAAGIATIATAVIAFSGPAFALPPGGASSDTPGTSSSVSPSTLAPCETLSYQVSGFPAGETVNVKIDDGIGYGDESQQGTGVIAQARIGSDGTASGSFAVPCDISEGAHWLRYLATETIGTDGSSLGYTNRGNSDFTVVKTSGSNSDNSGNSNNAAAVAAQGGNSTSTRRTVTRVVQPGEAASAGGNEPQAASNNAQQADSGNGNAVAQAAQAAAGSSRGAVAGTTLAVGAAAEGDDVEEVIVYDDQGQPQTAYVSAASANNGAPTIGLLVGGSILIVGLGGIAAYLYVNRARNTATTTHFDEDFS